MDIVSQEVRSRMMAGIRGKDTKPELLIRRGLHKLGFRFRIHENLLPGKPDIVLPRWRAVIFVHGCFWHGHDCPLFKPPATRRDFWEKKIGRNRERDVEVASALEDAGWRRLTIWECAFRGKTGIGIDATISRAAAWIREGLAYSEIRGKG